MPGIGGCSTPMEAAAWASFRRICSSSTRRASSWRSGNTQGEEHLLVGTADAVDAPVALHEPYRVPGQVVVDEPSPLLEVHPFGQHVGRNDDVIPVLGARRRGFRGLGREAEHGVAAGDPVERVGAPDDGDAATVAGEPPIRGHHLPQSLGDPLDGVAEVGEHEHLAPVADVALRDPLPLGLRRDAGVTPSWWTPLSVGHNEEVSHVGTEIRAGVQGADGVTGPCGTERGPAGSGVRAFGDGDPALGGAGRPGRGASHRRSDDGRAQGNTRVEA